MFKKITHIFIFVLFSFLFVHMVDAASISIEPGGSTGVFNVSIITNEGESFNAIEGLVSFNKNLPNPPTVQFTDSVLSLWLNKPEVSGDSIVFSGVIPGGFEGVYDQFTGALAHKGKLFSVTFPSEPNITEYDFLANGITLYSNDGKATPTTLPLQTFSFFADANNNPIIINNPAIYDPLAGYAPVIFFLFICFVVICVVWFLRKARKHILRK